MKYKLHPEAAENMTQITAHVAEVNVDAAIRLREALIATFELLALFPKAGARAPYTYVAQARYIPVKKFRTYIVFYVIKSGEIEILRIGSAARNWKNLLKT